MPRDVLESLPDDARIWVFGSGRALTRDEEGRLLGTVDAYLDGWAAHGQPLRSAREWRENRFLIVAVDQASVPPSGCSIDALVRELTTLERALGTTLVGHGAVWYRGRDGTPARVSRAEFKDRVSAGDADGDTPVFDTTLTALGALRAGAFERPARTTWHARAFGLGEGPRMSTG